MDLKQMNYSDINDNSMDHSKMHHMDNMDHMDGSMAMFFHFGSSETILFQAWKTETWHGMLVSCCVIFILALLYEGLKALRETLVRRPKCESKHDMQRLPTTEEADVSIKCQEQTRVPTTMLSLAHALQTGLHFLQVLLSYLLMLIFMTYNVYLCLAVVLGAATGYFLFSWRRRDVIDPNEHCH